MCPHMIGSQVSNTSFLPSIDFEEIYFYNELTTKTCNQSLCLESASRLACNLAYTGAGLLDVNVESRFPFLSYNKPAPFSTKTKSNPSTSKDKNTTIAYVLLVHENLNQTTRLLNAVYHPQNVYIVHVDSKAGKLKEDLIAYADGFSNIYVLEQSFNIRWGGVEMVYSTLEAMFAALDIDKKWDFIINLSSKDYPLCNDAELSSYLGTRIGKNFDVAELPPLEDEKFWRARAIYVWCEESPCFQYKQREMPFGINSYVGSQWFVYSREFAQYLRTNNFPKVALAHYEHTWVADEGYFGTVLMNSPYKASRIANNLRYIVFDQIHPYYLTTNDFPAIQKQTSSCFSRKFEMNDPVLDLIDAMRTSGNRKLALP